MTGFMATNQTCCFNLSWASVTYQFWTQADDDGYFMIPNVRPGDYELYGWVPGVFGDYKREGVITIQSGSSIDLDELLIFEAPRDGKTVWEIEVLLSSSSQIQIPNMLTVCFLITRKVIGLKTGSLPML